MEASSHTAIRMLLSRLKLVWRMAEVQRGSVSVVHLEKQQRHSSGAQQEQLLLLLLHLNILLS